MYPHAPVRCRDPSRKGHREQQKLSDGGGLFLLVHPNGSRYWHWKYRVNRKEKLLGMGIYPDVSLAQSREAREDARRQLASGVDRSEHRKSATASRAVADRESFEVIIREWLAGRPWAPTYGKKVAWFKRTSSPTSAPDVLQT